MVRVGGHQHRLVPLGRPRLVGDGRRQRGRLVVARDAAGRRESGVIGEPQRGQGGEQRLPGGAGVAVLGSLVDVVHVIDPELC